METVVRKWGYYLTLLRLPFFCLKILCFYPCHSLSLQRHFHRNELWIFLYGSGKLSKNYKIKRIGKFGISYIPRLTWHKFICADKETKVLEIQWGRKVREEDIERAM